MWMAVFSEKGFMWLVDMSILCCWLFAKKSSGSYDVLWIITYQHVFPCILKLKSVLLISLLCQNVCIYGR